MLSYLQSFNEAENPKMEEDSTHISAMNRIAIINLYTGQGVRSKTNKSSSIYTCGLKILKTLRA